MSAELPRARLVARRLLQRGARPLLDIQRVFAWLPPERPAGEGRYSFDMLGEGARTAADAERGMQRYLEALAAVRRGGISVKLSSIHERFDAASYPKVRGALMERLALLCARAAQTGVQLTLDAEESERCALQLDLFARRSRCAW